MSEAKCARCGILTEGLKEGCVCFDCCKEFKVTQKGRDFLAWLEREHPEIAERDMLNDVDERLVQ